MTLGQLRRVDMINLLSITCPIIQPIDYARFAILNQQEREECLKAKEDLIAQVEKNKEMELMN